MFLSFVTFAHSLTMILNLTFFVLFLVIFSFIPFPFWLSSFSFIRLLHRLTELMPLMHPGSLHKSLLSLKCVVKC